MPFKNKKPAFVFIIYWFLLAYIMAALIFWFFELNRQNNKMIELKLEQVQQNQSSPQSFTKIQEENKRKKAQYAGEGAIFLLVIIAGAIFVYRTVKKQLLLSQQQQNFMIAVTHELKTPVAIAKLNLETIKKRTLEPMQQQKLMQNTLQEINRLDVLCNNMLVSSQIEAGGYRMVKEDIDLSLLCYNVAEEFSQRYTGRKINCVLDKKTVRVIGDTILIKIAISNLLENALKYSSKESPVDLYVNTDNSNAIVQVKDNGPGIPQDERKKIFRKFYRLGNEATRSAKGTGLGLYLTQKIISAHKGNIFTKDNPAGGSIFIISIPLA